MSGGALDYSFVHMNETVRRIQEEIENLEALVNSGDTSGYRISQYYKNRFPEREEFKSEETLAKAVLRIYKNAVECLTKASIYSERIEWMLSGDDGPEALVLRVEEELNQEKKECT
jgi:nitrogen-specific signal transduction histidine kinase